MQNPHTPTAGQSVWLRDRQWLVVSSDGREGPCLISLRGSNPHEPSRLRWFVADAEVFTPVQPPRGLRRRSRHAVLRQAARAIAAASPWEECASAVTAAIDVREWQLTPVQAVLAGSPRVLLADGVGLGKTIEACLIIAELRARGLADRVLVLTPPALREQWAAEMRARFNLPAVVFDHDALAAAAAALPAEVNPWATGPVIVSSIDLVKRPETRSALAAVAFHVLIVDEAHHLSAGSDRAAAVSELATRTPFVVLASATPEVGVESVGADRQDLTLLAVGDTGSEQMRVFRRAEPRDAAQMARRTRLLAVRPTAAEARLLAATLDYVHALRRDGRRGCPGESRGATSHGSGARLVAGVIARRAASSAMAAHSTLARRLALLEGLPATTVEPRLPWDEAVDEDATLADAVLALPGLADRPHELQRLRGLVALAREAQPSFSKLTVLRRLLRRTGETLLVFSEYRDIVLQVASGLRDLGSIGVLHGALPVRERRQVLSAFTSGLLRALVATDAAGEGLNLQACCRIVINVELPWMPRRLEQRIGRVDRLGQRRTVHAINLVHKQSFESLVLARLERRRTRAQLATATDTATHLSAATVERRRAGQLAVSAFANDSAPCFAVHTARRWPSCHVRLLYALTLHAADGRAGPRETLTLDVNCQPSLRRLTRASVRAITRDPRVITALERWQGERVIATAASAERCAAAVTSRLHALRARLEGDQHALRWQGSLFDRRTEQQAHHRQEQRDALVAHLAAMQEAVTVLRQWTASTPLLVAAWLR